MKKRILGSFAIVGLLVTLVVAHVNARPAGRIVVKVPFNFMVGDKTLPAGEYFIVRNTQLSNEGLMIRSTDGRNGAFALTKTVQAGDRQEDSRLVFNRYGEHYFLTQVWSAGQSNGRELFRTSAEGVFAHAAAQNGGEVQKVYVVAKGR
jgi:hypothetical protein